MSLFHLTIPLCLFAFIKEQVLRYAELGAVVKEEWNHPMLRGGGIVVSLPTDQITTGISSSFSIRSKSSRVDLGKKCDNSNGRAHLHLNVRTFAFQFN